MLLKSGAGAEVALQCLSPQMIILRVLSRRAWTRESGTLFTTTISYRGQTDYMTTDAGIPVELVEKTSAEADIKQPGLAAGARTGPESESTDVGAVDVGSLPV